MSHRKQSSQQEVEALCGVRSATRCSKPIPSASGTDTDQCGKLNNPKSESSKEVLSTVDS
jgi:hypothetical protein